MQSPLQATAGQEVLVRFPVETPAGGPEPDWLWYHWRWFDASGISAHLGGSKLESPTYMVNPSKCQFHPYHSPKKDNNPLSSTITVVMSP